MNETNTINFAIDLGTTNSVIAKNEKGEVLIFKNPVGQKETLPSVVAFRNNRIIVGDKAREYLEKDSANVVGLFKRKMGTDHLFDIKSLDKKVSPVELSSYVLKEIKNFVSTGEQVCSVVITIPASFDTVQSNATKEAGVLAGFEEVFLLQEPIAAALAYTNQFVDKEENKKWIVYDLGGGTFDVALISLEDGELKIIDNKGDNYMGGLDFDNLIFENIIIPYLNDKGSFPENLIQDFKSASGLFHSKYYQIIKKCEELKVSLSTSEYADIEFEIYDTNNKLIDVYLEISRKEFNQIIKPIIDSSIRFVKDLIAENDILSTEIDSILLVGGSTYIPLVRDSLANELTIPVNTRIDPISAVAAGASYFASTKKKKKSPIEIKNSPTSVKLSVKTAYQKQTQLNSEYFVAQIEGDVEHKYYRITRKDGGFDSGLKILSKRIEETLSLISNANNQFELKIFDATQNLITSEYLEINQGKYGILGQPLPEDICLEIDDIEDNSTGLQLIFKKNELLPLKKMIVKEVTKTIYKGSNTSILINVLEGPQQASPTSNKPIGVIEINAKDLNKDLIRGTDVEIIIEITESRDLKIKTYFSQLDQEFEEVFSSTKRYVNIKMLIGIITSDF